MNHHILTGKVDVTSNLLVGSSHLFVDTTNNRVGLVTNDPHAGLHVNSNAYVDTDLRVGSQIEINTTPGRIKAASFEGDGSLLVNAPVGSLAVHSTDTGLPGTDAIVTNEGTPTAAEFKFVIPRGDVGATGTDATIAVGTTTTGAAGSSASVTNTGSSTAAVFDFTIPKGDQGIQGIQGIQGETGTAATVTAGTTTTGAAGTNASVTNTGSSSAASFDFTIPRGDTGATGPAGTVAIGTTTTGAAGSSASVTNTGTSTAANLEFTVPKGDQGIQGVQGPAATIAVGTTTTSAPGTNGSVTNSGSSSAAVFDFTVPRGADGTNYFTLSGSNIYRSTGNVGIGVTDPDSKLEVRGNIRASFDDTNHGMFIDAGGTILRNYGGNGAGLHFTANQIFPTNYLGAYSAGGIDLGSSTYRWNNVYTEALNASGTIDSTGIITCNANKMVITGSSPTLYLRDSNARTGMIHQNADRMYFLTGPANSDSWAQTANSRWPLYLQMDTNEAVFGGNIDAAVGTVTASTFSTTSQLYLGTSASIRQTSTPVWTGDPGSGVGKIEYHSNRWYIVAGSNSTELLQVRRNDTNKFTIDNNGSISLGIVPAARISGTVASATNADTVDGQHAHEMSWGHDTIHGTYSDFNSFTNTDKFGAHYVTGTTNGPGQSGRTQYYHQRMALGSNHNGYSLQLAIGRNGSDNYLWYRNEENGSLSSWYKMRAGYADTCGTAGSVTGQSQINKSAHSSGASDYHLELYSGNTGSSSNEVSIRFHQGSVWWGQLRFRSSQFYFTSGGDNSLYPINTGSIYNSGSLESDGRIYADNGCHVRGDWLRVNGNAGIYFESYGGGWYMTDSTYIRNYGSKMLLIEGSGARIYGTEASVNYPSSDTAYRAVGVVSDPANYAFGLFVDYSVRAAGYVAFSDRRIKSNVVDINDTYALEQVRKLKPKYYDYVDKATRGDSSVIGFIAQEVKEVVPRAVSVSDGDVPNIYETGNIGPGNTITFTKFDTSTLESSTKTLIVYLSKQDRKEVTVAEIIDKHTLRVEEDISEWGRSMTEDGKLIYEEKIMTVTPEEYKNLEDKMGYEPVVTGYSNGVDTISMEEYDALDDKTGYSEFIGHYEINKKIYEGTGIFVWGQKVNDFHHLNKDYLWTIGTAALQEVDRQLQAEKEKTKNLETLVLSLITRVQKLETR